MKTLILTNGSKTTAEEKDEIPMLDYFKGNFRTVSSLAKELKEYSDVDTYIISEEFGWVKGENKFKDVKKNSVEDEKFSEEIIEKLDHSDIVIILLPREKFQSLIIENWEKIVQKAKKGSIWCLGASKYILKSLQIKELENKNIKLITYERKGVVKLGKKEKRTLIRKIKNRN